MYSLLATTYQWNRGLRERGEKQNGFEISVSKTINVPLSVLYSSWVEENIRANWLKEEIVIRKQTENKSARITWSDLLTSLSIDFYTKGEDKSMVVVQHLKLPDAKKANEMKVYWNEALDHLKLFLEGNR